MNARGVGVVDVCVCVFTTELIAPWHDTHTRHHSDAVRESKEGGRKGVGGKDTYGNI